MVANWAVRFGMRLGFFRCGSHWPFTDQNPVLDRSRQTQSDQKWQIFFFFGISVYFLQAEPCKIWFFQTLLLGVWIFLHVPVGCHISVPVFLGCHWELSLPALVSSTGSAFNNLIKTLSAEPFLQLLVWISCFGWGENRILIWLLKKKIRIQTFISPSISLEQTNQLGALYEFTLALDISQQLSCSLGRQALQLTQIPLCFLDRAQRDIYFGYNNIFLLLLLWDSTFPEITSERCWGSGV